MTIEDVLRGLLASLHPKCQTCGAPATRMAQYVLILGELYFCDDHRAENRAYREPAFTDLPQAEAVRAARQFLGE